MLSLFIVHCTRGMENSVESIQHVDLCNVHDSTSRVCWRDIEYCKTTIVKCCRDAVRGIVYLPNCMSNRIAYVVQSCSMFGNVVLSTYFHLSRIIPCVLMHAFARACDSNRHWPVLLCLFVAINNMHVYYI